MSYVDEIIELVEKKNPAEPEFHQAVKEVMESLRVVIEANEEKYRKAFSVNVEKEKILGVTLSGSHKDDFEIKDGFVYEKTYR